MCSATLAPTHTSLLSACVAVCVSVFGNEYDMMFTLGNLCVCVCVFEGSVCVLLANQSVTKLRAAKHFSQILISTLDSSPSTNTTINIFMDRGGKVILWDIYNLQSNNPKQPHSIATTPF